MFWSKLCSIAGVLSFALNASSLTIGRGGKPKELIKDKRALQDIVTWDEHSIFVRGERIMLLNGEFHPYRLPAPGLWLDVFQKVKALGFAGVSFYTDWALQEGQEGVFNAEGVFSLDQFFAAASEAGIYLVARPGPYINAESSGGGFPGWLTRKTAIERTPEYLNYTALYSKSIGEIIAKAQITNGGPVILFQPENEYSQATSNVKFPDPDYFAAVEQMFRDAGIVVPFVSNDAFPHGYFAPGTGLGAVDIYGFDGYPLGFDCANPTVWPAGAIPTYYLGLHQQQANSTPVTISEFQGGSFDPWGGKGFDACAQLLNNEFERVFYKNNYAIETTIFNLYMIYGGTNWGNLGYPEGYTSYDYGASISEDRTVTREKYSEAKLEANFLKASPAYLDATVSTYGSNGSFVNTDAILTTQLRSNSTGTGFYIVRQADYASLATTKYKLKNLPTSIGSLTIPQLQGSLELQGRDSKVHVTDYDIGGTTVLYSTAEIFTWQKYGSNTILLVYGGAGETHEIAFKGKTKSTVLEGAGVTKKALNGNAVLNWQVTPARKVVQISSNVFVYLLWRNEAYNYWTLQLPSPSTVDLYTSPSVTSVVVKAGYLLRTATLNGGTLALTGDLNATVPLSITGAPSAVNKVTFNGNNVQVTKNTVTGEWTGRLRFTAPSVTIPDLASLEWKYLDSLPEIQNTYDDSAWTNADLTYTNNTLWSLKTPTSLLQVDYGYIPAVTLFRGHFTATGAESSLLLYLQGGNAFASSVFLNNTFLGSWVGNATKSNWNLTVPITSLKAGKPYVFTISVDNQGLEEDGEVGTDGPKTPRGILNYTLAGRPQNAITWKIQGNLGGENYADKTRGPLNEDGWFAERMGYHLPAPPDSKWKAVNPVTTGVSKAGTALFTTNFDLQIPAGYDIPISVSFGALGGNYRVELFVNGYQFGKFVANVGPQVEFPVPQGILDYSGRNYVALLVWALEGAVKVNDVRLVPTAVVQSGYGNVEMSPITSYAPRMGAH
ncbi:hypothetical protein MMC25_006281 [Agyrium rufum]|nr:hypothetical protein [Agyrium rufum]